MAADQPEIVKYLVAAVTAEAAVIVYLFMRLLEAWKQLHAEAKEVAKLDAETDAAQAEATLAVARELAAIKSMLNCPTTLGGGV